MKNSLIAVVLFVAFTSLQLNAQTQTSSSENLSDSSKALQFQIASNFTLTSFQGTVFSYKHHLSRNTALRIGLSIGLGGQNRDGETTGFYVERDSVFPVSNNGTDRTGASIQLTAQHIWYFNPASKVLLFGGAGPLAGYDYNYEKTESILGSAGSSPMISNNETKSKQWSFGISGVMGVEWFVSKGISLSAEYGLQANYYWWDSEGTGTYTNSSFDHITQKANTSVKGWNLSGNYAKLGLSLYFQ
ncbi:MAG TPA: hypothetical protein VHO03_20055 [Ignavibacteriales bacterium]|nr:hypothetical protein [Ignavibacteriales bacterium]